MRTTGLRLERAPRLELPLRYFLTAPLFGAAAGVLLLVEGSPLLSSPWHPHTIALAHAITLGVLTMTMLGALHQLLPVLLGAELPGMRWSPLLHAAFTLGVAALAGGLLGGWPPLVAAGGALLAASLLPLLGMFAACLVRPGGQGSTVWLLRLALAAFAGTIALGLLFAAGHAFGGWVLPRRGALPLHVLWSLGGWVGALIVGTGMAVLPMFTIAPPVSAALARTVTLALAGLLLSAPLPLLAGGGSWSLVPALACGAVALAAFTMALLRLLRERRRKVADVSLRFWQGGLVGAWVALGLAGVAVVLPHPRWALAAVTMYLLGFAGAVLCGMLYRIVPFLVWMHRFSRAAGGGPVPTMSDLLPRAHARRQQWLYALAVGLLTTAALVPQEASVRAAGGIYALACGYLWVNLLRAVRFRPVATPGRAAETPAAGAARAGAE